MRVVVCPKCGGGELKFVGSINATGSDGGRRVHYSFAVGECLVCGAGFRVFRAHEEEIPAPQWERKKLDRERHQERQRNLAQAAGPPPPDAARGYNAYEETQ